MDEGLSFPSEASVQLRPITRLSNRYSDETVFYRLVCYLFKEWGGVDLLQGRVAKKIIFSCLSVFKKCFETVAVSMSMWGAQKEETVEERNNLKIMKYYSSVFKHWYTF